MSNENKESKAVQQVNAIHKAVEEKAQQKPKEKKSWSEKSGSLVLRRDTFLRFNKAKEKSEQKTTSDFINFLLDKAGL